MQVQKCMPRGSRVPGPVLAGRSCDEGGVSRPVSAPARPSWCRLLEASQWPSRDGLCYHPLLQMSAQKLSACEEFTTSIRTPGVWSCWDSHAGLWESEAFLAPCTTYTWAGPSLLWKPGVFNMNGFQTAAPCGRHPAARSGWVEGRQAATGRGQGWPWAGDASPPPALLPKDKPWIVVILVIKEKGTPRCEWPTSFNPWRVR